MKNREAELLRQLPALEEGNASLLLQRNEARDKLDAVNHERMNRTAACRALELALVMMTNELRKAQLKSKEFGFKDSEWVALAE